MSTLPSRETRRQRAATNLAEQFDPLTGPQFRAELLVSLATRWTDRATEDHTLHILATTQDVRTVLDHVDPADQPTIHAVLDDDVWRLRWVTVYPPTLTTLHRLITQLRQHPDVWTPINAVAHQETIRLQQSNWYRTPRITFTELVNRARHQVAA